MGLLSTRIPPNECIYIQLCNNEGMMYSYSTLRPKCPTNAKHPPSILLSFFSGYDLRRIAIVISTIQCVRGYDFRRVVLVVSTIKYMRNICLQEVNSDSSSYIKVIG